MTKPIDDAMLLEAVEKAKSEGTFVARVLLRDHGLNSMHAYGKLADAERRGLIRYEVVQTDPIHDEESEQDS